MTTLRAHQQVMACTHADLAICCRGGVAYQLANTAAAKSNVAIFQLTAMLPFSREVVFLGGQIDEQKTVRGPVNMCAGCTPEKSPKPETHPERLTALSGKPQSSNQSYHFTFPVFRTHQGRNCRLIDGLIQNQTMRVQMSTLAMWSFASTAFSAITQQ